VNVSRITASKSSNGVVEDCIIYDCQVRFITSSFVRPKVLGSERSPNFGYRACSPFAIGDVSCSRTGRFQLVY